MFVYKNVPKEDTVLWIFRQNPIFTSPDLIDWRDQNLQLGHFLKLSYLNIIYLYHWHFWLSFKKGTFTELSPWINGEWHREFRLYPYYTATVMFHSFLYNFTSIFFGSHKFKILDSNTLFYFLVYSVMGSAFSLEQHVSGLNVFQQVINVIFCNILITTFVHFNGSCHSWMLSTWTF